MDNQEWQIRCFDSIARFSLKCLGRLKVRAKRELYSWIGLIRQFLDLMEVNNLSYSFGGEYDGIFSELCMVGSTDIEDHRVEFYFKF